MRSARKTSRSRTSPSRPASQRSGPRKRPSRADGSSRRNSATSARIRRRPTRIWCTPSGSIPSKASSALSPIWARHERAIGTIASRSVASRAARAAAPGWSGPLAGAQEIAAIRLRTCPRPERDAIGEGQGDLEQPRRGSAVQLELELADRLAREAGAHLAPIEVEAPLADLIRQTLVGPLHLGLEDGLERLPREHVDHALAHRLVGNRREIRPLAFQLDLELRPREESGRALITELQRLPLATASAPQPKADPFPREDEVAAVEVDRMEMLDLGVGEGGRAQDAGAPARARRRRGRSKASARSRGGGPSWRVPTPASVAPCPKRPPRGPGFTDSSRNRHTQGSSAGYRPAASATSKGPHELPMREGHDIPASHRDYLNRELSQLEFIARVISIAEDPGDPPARAGQIPGDLGPDPRSLLPGARRRAEDPDRSAGVAPSLRTGSSPSSSSRRCARA